MKKSVTEAMCSVEYIRTTTDCWSSRRHRFIDMTARWIDPDNLQQCSAALACLQLKGSHTFDVLAAAIQEIHFEFAIHEKVACMTTDNGSNCLKDFRVYGGENMHGKNTKCARTTLSEHDGSDTEDEKCEKMNMLRLNFESGISFSKESKLCLPSSQLGFHCGCWHCSIRWSAYKRLSRSSFSKFWALWKKSGRTNKAAEKMEKECRMQLMCPNATRWNSLFLSVERILKIMKEKGDGVFRNLCVEFKIPMWVML